MMAEKSDSKLVLFAAALLFAIWLYTTYCGAIQNLAERLTLK